MHTAKIHIRKENGRLDPVSREIVLEAIRNAPDGRYDLILQGRPEGYSATRYRYYFGHIVTAILLTCSEKFRIVAPNGEMRTPQTVEEMHEVLKFYYNPVTIITPKGHFTTGKSTTGISDRDFVQTYLESIMADFSQPPYNVEFITREEWAEIMKSHSA